MTIDRSTPHPSLRLDEPVIVLTCARSGSTLLRFILDTHPVLACPPEIGIVDMCSRMGTIWTMFGNVGGGSGSDIDRAVTLARCWVDETYAAYLTQVGKQRWCDKTICSASSAQSLEFFLKMYPRARFICLYRHCMDVVDSILEACPWGVRGYGLEPFVVNNPGNNVAAVADYWSVHTRAIAAFEKAHPELCLRLRYEDFVADPGTQAAWLFEHLDVPPVPGIVEKCFATERHLGPGDYKILATHDVHRQSVGRGRRIPPQLIPPHMRDAANTLLAELGYSPVDEGWRDQLPSAVAGESDGATDAGFDRLEGLLASRISGRDEDGDPANDRSLPSFILTAKSAGDESRSWRIDLRDRTVGRIPSTASATRAEWGAVATTDIWKSIIGGELNVGTALKNGALRYRDMREHDDGTNPLHLWADTRMRILARTLSP